MQQAAATPSGAGPPGLQAKRALVAAVRGGDYAAASAALGQALAAAPGDGLLLEFQAAVAARLAQQESSGSDASEGASDSDASDASDESEGASTSGGYASNADSDADSDASSASSSGEAPASGHSGAALAQGAADGGAAGGGAAASADAAQPRLAGIRLAPGCSTLSAQRRAELRRLLAAAAEREQVAALAQRLAEADPLLAAAP
ncbi:hypothetical protein HT031_001527 [Scenedesmus sp. PABB004]|nr:hypothetical protein HT031_001527 [Scenedesmus sp. PABB004]